jgi:hypothetical protein
VNDQQQYERAKKRVEEIKGFYSHLFVYILINAVLLLINIITSRGHWWFYWPLIGWGIGIIAHASSVFGFFGFFGQEWEERKIKEIMEKDRGRDREVQ